MGFFSALCEGCKHPILSIHATNAINQWMNMGVAIAEDGTIYTGSYDGYGQLWLDDEPQITAEKGMVGMWVGDERVGGSTVWHEACWRVAGYPTDYRGTSENAPDQGWFFDDHDHDLPEPQGGEDKGRNPFGKCSAGHLFFRGGCPGCAADQTMPAALAALLEQRREEDTHEA